jgi:hypothetical protein
MRSLLAILLFQTVAFADQTLPSGAADADSVEVQSIAARGPLAFQSAISLVSEAGCSRGYSHRATDGSVALTVGADDHVKLVVDTHTTHNHGGMSFEPGTNKMVPFGSTEVTSERQVWAGRAHRKQNTLELDLSLESEPDHLMPKQIHVQCRPNQVAVGDPDPQHEETTPMHLLQCPFELLRDPSDPLVRLSSNGGVTLGSAPGIQMNAEDRRYGSPQTRVVRAAKHG